MPPADVNAILAAGRASYPHVTASPDALARLVHQRLDANDHAESLVHDEIFLACACALGDSAAIAAFERQYFSAISVALSRLSLGRDEIAEIEQILRVRLFVSDPEGEVGALPRIVVYAGRGQLGGLLRVAAVRAGLNLLRDRGRLESHAGDGLEEIPIATDDPELANLKAQHRIAFKAAFEEAISSLAPRERTLLDLSVVKQLGIDKISAIYSVHRATAARWIASARDELTRAVYRSLEKRLGVRARDELDDLLPLVESQLELSLERLLRSRAA